MTENKAELNLARDAVLSNIGLSRALLTTGFLCSFVFEARLFPLAVMMLVLGFAEYREAKRLLRKLETKQ